MIDPQFLVGLTRSAGGGHWAQRIDELSGGGGYCHAFIFWPAMGQVWESHFDFGVRFRDRRPNDREELYRPPSLSENQAALAIWQMNLLAGCGYDCPGAYHSGEPFGAKWVKEDPSKYFCSEAVLTAIAKAGYLTNWIPADTSPNELASVVKMWERTQ